MDYKSGIKGVQWNKNSAKWQSIISVDNQRFNLGSYTTVEEAQIAREKAEARLADGTFYEFYTKPRSRKRKYEDLTGKRFGKLVVIHRVYNGNARWLCQCDCGKETLVSAGSLKHGQTKSCGCLRGETIPANSTDLCGSRFGWLVVLERTEKRSQSGDTVWKCQCDCGAIAEVSRSKLTAGYTKSCGCLRHALKFAEGTNVNVIKSKKLHKGNTSGIKGVSWNRSSRKWCASIQFKGKSHYLGVYKDINEAAQARKCAEEQLHGPFLEWYEEYKKSLLPSDF
jgi:hypothetical protein